MKLDSVKLIEKLSNAYGVSGFIALGDYRAIVDLTVEIKKREELKKFFS